MTMIKILGLGVIIALIAGVSDINSMLSRVPIIVKALNRNESPRTNPIIPLTDKLNI